MNVHVFEHDCFFVEFTPKHSVATPDLFLLEYNRDAVRFIGDNTFDGDGLDAKSKLKRTEPFSEFTFYRLDHVIYGELKHENRKWNAQVAMVVSHRYDIGFYPFLLLVEDGSLLQPASTSKDGPCELLIVDYKDYCKTMDLLEQPKLPFKQYVQQLLEMDRRMSSFRDFRDGKEIKDFNTMFNLKEDKFNSDYLMSIKGFDFFLEEEIKKKC